jgi:hypothetical protein
MPIMLLCRPLIESMPAFALVPQIDEPQPKQARPTAMDGDKDADMWSMAIDDRAQALPKLVRPGLP